MRSPMLEVNELQYGDATIQSLRMLGAHKNTKQAGEAGSSTAPSAFIHMPQTGRETRDTISDN